MHDPSCACVRAPPNSLFIITSSCPIQGFENIVNADMSRVAIYQMNETYKAYPMECELTTL